MTKVNSAKKPNCCDAQKPRDHRGDGASCPWANAEPAFKFAVTQTETVGETFQRRARNENATDGLLWCSLAVVAIAQEKANPPAEPKADDSDQAAPIFQIVIRPSKATKKAESSGSSGAASGWQVGGGGGGGGGFGGGGIAFGGGGGGGFGVGGGGQTSGARDAEKRGDWLAFSHSPHCSKPTSAGRRWPLDFQCLRRSGVSINPPRRPAATRWNRSARRHRKPAFGAFTIRESASDATCPRQKKSQGTATDHHCEQFGLAGRQGKNLGSKCEYEFAGRPAGIAGKAAGRR